MNNKPIHILGFSVHAEIANLNLNSTTTLVNTINPHSYCVSKQDNLFREALQNSDVLLPDGIGIVIAAKLLVNKKIHRISGADLHDYLLQKANESSAKVFYLGSSPATLAKIEERLTKEYPNIQFKTYSPPYKATFSDAENKEMLNAINSFHPNILFIGMTAPKQEKWAYQHKELLDVNVIASIGAVFDFYAGTVKRPGIFWQKIGMEWFPRLLREPKRLWRRNFVSTPCFLWDVLKAKLGW